jgi:hypothetical protein
MNEWFEVFSPTLSSPKRLRELSSLSPASHRLSASLIFIGSFFYRRSLSLCMQEFDLKKRHSIFT